MPFETSNCDIKLHTAHANNVDTTIKNPIKYNNDETPKAKKVLWGFLTYLLKISS